MQAGLRSLGCCALQPGLVAPKAPKIHKWPVDHRAGASLRFSHLHHLMHRTRTHLISSPLAMAFEQRRQRCYAASRGSTAIGWQLVRSGRFVLSLEEYLIGDPEQLAFILGVCCLPGREPGHSICGAPRCVCLPGGCLGLSRTLLQAAASLAPRECPSPPFLVSAAEIGHSRTHFGGWRAAPFVSRVTADISPLSRR